MKIINASVELLTEFDGDKVMKFLERCARTAYKSEDAIKDGSADKLIANIIKRGHESVLEHFSVAFKIICDRGVSHELVRHRLASFTQQSTRYCNYASDRFGNELTFIKPYFWNRKENAVFPKIDRWKAAMQFCEQEYKCFLNKGATPEQARAILPNSLATEIIMTANLREWRHILKLRTAKDAHPQMREIAIPILNILKEKLPVIFFDIEDAQSTV